MNGKDALGIVLFIILPFAFTGIYLPELLINITYGRKLGLLGCLTFFLAPVIVVVIFYVGLFFPFAPSIDSSLQHYRFSQYTLLVTITPFMINLIIRELIRRIRLKDDIIELERIEIKPNIQLVIGIGGLIYVGYDLFSGLLEQGTADLTTVLGIVFFLAALVFTIMIITSKRHLTRKGISQLLGTIEWDTFTAYRWSKPKGGKIDLTFHRRYGGPIQATIPLSKKEEVDNYINNLGNSHLLLPHGNIRLEEVSH